MALSQVVLGFPLAWVGASACTTFKECCIPPGKGVLEMTVRLFRCSTLLLVISLTGRL